MVREEIFGPCCHVRPFDTEEEAVRARQRHALRPRRHRSGPTNLARAHRRRRAIEVGIVLGQLLVPARPAHALRRIEAVRHRPRGRRAFARVLHRAAQRLRQAVNTAGRFSAPDAANILKHLKRHKAHAA